MATRYARLCHFFTARIRNGARSHKYQYSINANALKLIVTKYTSYGTPSWWGCSLLRLQEAYDRVMGRMYAPLKNAKRQ